jgi:hypothetical protein
MSALQMIEALGSYGPDARVVILDDQGRELSFGVYGCTGSQTVVVLDVTLDADGNSKEA